MPKTDNLGKLIPRSGGPANRRGAAGSAPAPDAVGADPTLPPAAMREIVTRLCDDRTLHQQIRRALDRRLEELGNQAFGERLREPARGQQERALPFYDSYYMVLAGDPNRNVVGYLEEIGWRPQATSASAPLPLCSQCGRQFPAGTLFCPQHGATLTAGGTP